MALSQDQKQAVVAEVGELLANSKLTVLAKYPGTSVKAMQNLRHEARNHSTVVRVIKNRLVKRALGGNDKFQKLDASIFSGQLLYAFNSEDEVAPAKDLADFAKTQPQIEFVGAISADGHLMSAIDVKVLAELPTKEQLHGQLVGMLAAPLSGFINVTVGNLRGLLNVLTAQAEKVN